MKVNLKSKLMLIILLIFIFDILIFSFFSKDFSNNILYLARINVEEITRDYLNHTIKKYLNVSTNNYIKTNLVNNNIISVDIDNRNSNILLQNVINDLENNVCEVVNNVNYTNLELIKDSNAFLLYIPLGVVFNNSLLVNLGPKIPIKISFLENIDAFVDVEVSNYGINNSLIKLYININIKTTIEIPIDKEVTSISYKYLVASKLINGKVPSLYGSNLSDNSNIVNSSVN